MEELNLANLICSNFVIYRCISSMDKERTIQMVMDGLDQDRIKDRKVMINVIIY